MGPDPRPGPYHVDLEQVSDDVAEATLAYFPIGEARRVARADEITQYLLADDPVRNGQPGSEGLYRLVVSPLVFRYEVYESARLVRVTAVRFFRV